MQHLPLTTRFSIVCISVVFLTAFGLVQTPIVFGQTGVAEVSQPISNENYRIGPGDIVDVVVNKNAELSRTGLRVGYDGTIQLAMLDENVAAACLTERQLADAIKEKYRKYLVNPFINVSVKEVNSNPVAVIGAVNSPGRFQLQRQIRLVELLTFVNGPSNNAGNTVEIIRNLGRPRCDESLLVAPAEAGEELLSVNLSDAFKTGERINPLIFAGDIVRIAEANQTNAYIQGNVRSTLAINLKDPVTLSQAIAMAGGTTKGADLAKIKIRRQVAGSLTRDEILVNLKEINQRKRDDVLLQPNDIIDIPGPTGGRKIYQDIMGGIVPMLTRLPYTVIP
jgi:polysaccharide biosynthesis/export protein